MDGITFNNILPTAKAFCKRSQIRGGPRKNHVKSDIPAIYLIFVGIARGTPFASCAHPSTKEFNVIEMDKTVDLVPHSKP